MIETKGTAIGSALAVSINRMRESDSKSKVCILLSDGESNAGNIDPITAAKLAAVHNIKIYTIIAGRQGLVPFKTDFFGNPRMIESMVDETTMRKIAEIGSGQFFRAEDDRALAQVWATIDQYEKAEIKETRFKNTTDFYYVYLLWGMCFLLLWLLLKSTFLNNVLQD
jgi:Ca-activated chloride channel family protein